MSIIYQIIIVKKLIKKKTTFRNHNQVSTRWYIEVTFTAKESEKRTLIHFFFIPVERKTRKVSKTEAMWNDQKCYV